MIERRFHADLYRAAAIEAATTTYAPWGAFESESIGSGWIVRIRANDGIDEAQLADEVANFALGTTIEASRQAEAGGSA